WSYFDLQTKIESKAKEYGIEVRKVNPKFTSQRCNNCGVISKDNRPNQETYQCTCQRKTRDGMKTYKTNADLNAARNIAIDGIEDIIYEQALYQGLIKPKESKKKVKKAS
ncbi:zinc ribbon domain-containing protein, partial [Staphylococcus capitis]|uniref:zinc ribbon domain-containing protein n=1 Tax=Staphylococcus capitis TaxID=29388 RepID=UPI00066B3431